MDTAPIMSVLYLARVASVMRCPLNGSVDNKLKTKFVTLISIGFVVQIKKNRVNFKIKLFKSRLVIKFKGKLNHGIV